MKYLLLLISALAGFVTAFTPAARPTSHKTILLEGTNSNERIPLKRGSTCALITPFTETGKIDVPGLEKLLQWHLDGGTDNLCVLGTTAEAAVMSMQERATVLKTVVNKVKGKIPLLIGTGTINPESVKAMTQQAIDLGADASLLVTPYYVKPPQRALIRHFTQMADMGLPTILYNVPGRTASNIQDDTIALLAQHENIIGIKDATGDLDRLKSVKLALGPHGKDFLFYSGDDGTTKDFVLQGGDGCISVTANIVPHMMHDMVHAALDGNVKLANQLDEHLQPLHAKLFVESNPIACKWAAKRIGLIDTDFCRPPLDAMDEKFAPVVDEALRSAGFLGVHRLHAKITAHDDLSLPVEERVLVHP